MTSASDIATSLAALESPEPFDLIFLDANKDAYPKYRKYHARANIFLLLVVSRVPRQG